MRERRMSTTEIEKKNLEAHVEICAERYKNLETKLENLEQRMDGFETHLIEIKRKEEYLKRAIS